MLALAFELVPSTGPGPSDDAYGKILTLEPSFLALQNWFCFAEVLSSLIIFNFSTADTPNPITQSLYCCLVCYSYRG